MREPATLSGYEHGTLAAVLCRGARRASASNPPTPDPLDLSAPPAPGVKHLLSRAPDLGECLRHDGGHVAGNNAVPARPLLCVEQSRAAKAEPGDRAAFESSRMRGGDFLVTLVTAPSECDSTGVGRGACPPRPRYANRQPSEFVASKQYCRVNPISHFTRQNT